MRECEERLRRLGIQWQIQRRGDLIHVRFDVRRSNYSSSGAWQFKAGDDDTEILKELQRLARSVEEKIRLFGAE